ncbi:MAG: cytochrome P450 [Elusimicrobia bacterium]|nr:cytochrome P450 [Elusimicrobiota bacterium]
MSRKIPGPSACLVLSSLKQFKENPLAVMLDGQRRYGDVVAFRFGTMSFHFISHPRDLQHVLQSNQKNYSRQTPGYEAMRIVLGNGLVTSDGEFWLRQRRISQPAFHRQRVAGFAQVMVDAALETAARWETEVGTGKPLDVAAEMMRLTLKIVGLTLMSTDVSAASSEVGQAVGVSLHELQSRIYAPYLHLPMQVPTISNRRLRAAVKTVDGVVLGMIAQRRNAVEEGSDFLGMLMEARDEDTGETMSDAQLRDELLTLFMAGHETTANALAWTWYLLSVNPAVRARLEGEVEKVLGKRPPSFADLPALAYSRMVVSESMRLYPPAWVLSRCAIKGDEIGGFPIKAGSVVFMSPFVTQRREDLWDNPEGFDPQRFDPGAPKPRPFAYFPFGGGGHQCIGAEFAMMEAQLIVVALLQRCRLNLVSGHPVELEPLITLRPKHGMRMLYFPREAAGAGARV